MYTTYTHATGLRFISNRRAPVPVPLLAADAAQEQEEEEEEEEEEESESYEMESIVNLREPRRFGKGWRLTTTV